MISIKRLKLTGAAILVFRASMSLQAALAAYLRHRQRLLTLSTASIAEKSSMGIRFEAICLDCSQPFKVDDGGGFFFELVRCESCGESTSVSHGKVAAWGSRIIRMMKEHGREMRWPFPADDPTYRALFLELASKVTVEYNQSVESTIGRCRCGGRFTMDAPIRCPGCGSLNITKGKPFENYD
jgi:hypothetical protein